MIEVLLLVSLFANGWAAWAVRAKNKSIQAQAATIKHLSNLLASSKDDDVG